jgi:asparagine synthase (glutamine-hydrolysing)
MAGIFGICRFDDRPVERTLVVRMSEALAHRGPDGEGVTIQRTTALGHRQLRITPESRHDTQPIVRASGTTLVFDGRLDNRDDVIAEVRAHHDVSPGTSDAQLAAFCYEIIGPDFARHLAGDFAVALFDCRERLVVLARDAIGIRPLYYRRDSLSLTFASEIKAIFVVDPGVPVRPNDRLLAELLLGQLHRQDDDGSTLFEGIHGVPASHVAIFSNTRTIVRRYWDFDGRPAPGKSFDDYAEGFRYHFRRAVERRLRSTSPVAVAVSGGLDSSSIFCVASKAASATRLAGFTYTTRDGGASDESAFVREVDRVCGRPIEFLDPRFEGSLFRSNEVIEATEAPMLDAQWFRAHRLLTAAQAAGARTVLTGDWGDHLLFDQAYLVDLLHAGSWLTVRAHLREYRRWYLDATSEFARRFLSDVMEYDLPYWFRRMVRGARSTCTRPAPWDDWYSQRFRNQAGPDIFAHDLRRQPRDAPVHAPTVLAHALYREVRSRYHGLCLEWNNKTAARYGAEYAFPFLDRDLVEFLMGVPGPVLTQHGVPKALLRRALSGVVPTTVLQRRTKGDFTADVNEATRVDYQTIIRMLGPDALVVQFGYVDVEKLRKGLAALEGVLGGSASCVASWRVTALVALELWLQQFGVRRGQLRDNAV